jgi:hypothetical protein
VIVRDSLVTFCFQGGKGAAAGGIRTGADMITIRYADLPEGLHAMAEAHGRRTVIYLRPGLTAEQRRLSLRRARQSARMGYGPRLPGRGVALAVARHVSSGTLRNLGAAVRRHPLGFMLLSAGFAGLMLFYALFVTVSVRLMLDPGQPPAAERGPLPAWVVPATTAPRHGGVAPAVLVPRHPHGRQGTPRVADEHHRRAPGPGPTAQAPPAPSPTASPVPSPRPTSPRPTSPSPPPPRPSVCVTVGPVGVCL